MFWFLSCNCKWIVYGLSRYKCNARTCLFYVTSLDYISIKSHCRQKTITEILDITKPEIHSFIIHYKDVLHYSDIFLFEVENKIHQPGHVRQRGSSLDMPLCMRDEIVAPLTARVSSSTLYVSHSQLPQSQIVGEHVHVGKQRGSQGICLRR